MHKYIFQFLNDVCEQIKYKSTHGHISEELQCHIGKLADKYIENGMDENEAVKKAVKQMGDPVDIGRKLDKIHRPKTEWSIISLIGVMISIGGIVLFSIASDGFLMIGSHQLIRYAIYILLGIGICVFFYFFDYTKLEKYSLHIFIGAIVFLFVSTKFGLKLNGIPYVKIGAFSFAVVPIALPLFFILLSGIANKWATGNIRHIFKLLGLAAIAAIFSCFIQPSVSVFMLLIAGFLVIITIAIMGKTFKGNRKKFLLSIYGFLTTSFILMLMNIIWRKPYIKARLLTFLNPGLDPDGEGYINVALVKLLSTAKLLGKNDNLYLNFEGVKTLALPEASTDFIFTYIISAFGWLA
ncbi:MAG: FtsW/RodA/SpoVE family cell cycle protein, partial [Alkaliphilus sp.]|nr:FtsW/RodA/SpoVE family cell cycle protein [Alkaliphilus sp.]